VRMRAAFRAFTDLLLIRQRMRRARMERRHPERNP
jgi:hypothetical protein